MSKVKSKEFISSDSDSDSASDSESKGKQESTKSEGKGEKRKSIEANLDQEDATKKQKVDSDEQPKKKEPEKPAKKQSESESESSDEEAKKKKAKKEKKKKSKEKSDKDGGAKKKEKKKAPTTKPVGNARKGFDLGRERKISVSEFKGRRYVNIREYYDAGGGEMRPGKKGVSLNREQWDMLTQVKDEVNAAETSKDKFWELGNNKRVSFNEFRGNVLYDIREYYDAQGEMKPGKKGISLSWEQWCGVHAVTDEITDAII